jgi:hypothetical protein
MEGLILEVPVCASSGRSGLSSPGGHPGNPEPAGDCVVASSENCLLAGFALLLDLVLGTMSRSFCVLQQMEKGKKKILMQGSILLVAGGRF